MNYNVRPEIYNGKLFFKDYKWHVFAWLFFAVYESTAVMVVAGKFAEPMNYLLHYAVNIVLFYVFAELALPGGLQDGKPSIPILTLNIFGLIVTYLLVSYGVDQILLLNKGITPSGDHGFSRGFIMSTLWRGIYFMSFATTYFYVRRSVRQRSLMAKLQKEAYKRDLMEKEREIELADAKNAYLLAQINPHFLFNTLTYIYDKIVDSSPDAGRAILYLSKMMRYAIQSHREPEKADLHPEIMQVENLIELCRIRNTEQHITFIYPDDILKVRVIPLILLTLTENMIKHGNLSSPEDPAVITIKLIGGYVEITTDNLKNPGVNDSSFHTGLGNIQKRLKYSYGGKATFSSSTDLRNHFMVTLKIPLED